MAFLCDPCGRTFASQEALQQHIRDSPAHTATFDCESCDRAFTSEQALEQHLRDSPAHTPSFDGESCARTFTSEQALEQHLRDSPAQPAMQGHLVALELLLDIFAVVDERVNSGFDYRLLPKQVEHKLEVCIAQPNRIADPSAADAERSE